MTAEPKLKKVKTIGILRTQIGDYHVTEQIYVEGDTPANGLIYIATPFGCLDFGGYSEPVQIIVMCPSIFESRHGEIMVRE